MGDEYIAYVLCSRRRSYNVLNKSRKKCNLEKPFLPQIRINYFFLKVQIHYCTIFRFFLSLWIMPFAYTYDMKKKIKDS